MIHLALQVAAFLFLSLVGLILAFFALIAAVFTWGILLGVFARIFTR
jgi:hypothetical protein